MSACVVPTNTPFKVYWGNAAVNPGRITFAQRPESRIVVPAWTTTSTGLSIAEALVGKESATVAVTIVAARARRVLRMGSNLLPGQLGRPCRPPRQGPGP